MKSEFELLQAVKRIEEKLPTLTAAFDSTGLRDLLMEHYDVLMVEAPRNMQDRLHDKLRAVMVQAGIVRERERF